MHPVRFALIVLGLLLVASCATDRKAADSAAVVNTGVFVSASGEQVRAVYRDDDTVTLTMADGRQENLHIAVSGSGSRYVEGAHEWWEHQGEATLSVDGKVVFRGRRQ